MIPDEAVEAAADWLPHSGDCEVRPERDCTCRQPRVALMRAALEAAYPHLLSHEREETRLAHLDAVVNAATVDRLERELHDERKKVELLLSTQSRPASLFALAEAWDKGAAAQAKCYGMDKDTGPNPYRK